MMSPRKRSRPTMQTDVLNFTVTALEWAVPAPCCDARTETHAQSSALADGDLQNMFQMLSRNRPSPHPSINGALASAARCLHPTKSCVSAAHAM